MFAKEEFDASGLNLHAGTGQRSAVAIFVHGFCGEGYKTWTGFHECLFDEHFGPAMDVATMDYRSGYRTPLGRGRDPSLAANDLTRHITQLGQHYETIIIIAHSLGGLISMAAVQRYFAQHPRLDDPLTALFFFGSPRLGSKLAVPPLRNYNKELRWLHPGSPEVKNLDSYFATSVQSNLIAETSFERRLLPTFLCTGKSDRVADDRSTSFGHSADRILSLEAGHSEITKPTRNNHSQIDWLYEKLALASGARRQAARQANFGARLGPTSISGAHLTAQFWVEPDRLEWLTLIHSNVRDASPYPIRKVDMIGQYDGPVNVLASVHHATSITDSDLAIRRLATDLGTRRLQGHVDTWVALVVGRGSDSAREHLLQLISKEVPRAHRAGGIFVVAVEREEGLPDAIQSVSRLAISEYEARAAPNIGFDSNVERQRGVQWRSE